MGSCRIIVHALGSAGDVRPVMAIARALSDHGHRVTFCGNSHDAPLAESISLPFQPVGPAWDVRELATRPDLLHPLAGSARLLRTVILPRIEHTFRDLLRVAKHDDGPVDLLIGHHTSFAVPWIAERLGVPWAMAAVAPASWPSIENPSVYPGMPDRDTYRRPLLKLGMAGGRWYTNLIVDAPLNAARSALALPPIRSAVFEHAFSGTLNLGLWPEHFRAPASDDPPRTIAVGFPRWPVSRGSEPALPPPVERFIASDAQTPIIAITLGTTAIHQGAAVINAALDACAALSVRAIVLGGDPDAARDRPGVIHAPWAEHDALFPRVQAVLHHGGIGTTAACLRAARPAVIVPFTHDQPDNARRSRLLGVSTTVPRRRAASPKVLAQAIHHALHDAVTQARVRRIAGQLHQQDGAEVAADRLSEIIGPQRPAIGTTPREHVHQ